MILANPIVGKRVYLRPLTDQDATEEYCGWLNDKEVNRYLATKSATIPELRNYIVTKNAQADAIFLGINLTANNQWIGTIKLEPINWKEKQATIAIMLGDKAHWGQGLGPEAMQLFMDYAERTFGITEFELGVRAQNEAALRAYQKIGFQEIKREFHAIQDGDAWLDQVTMVRKHSHIK